MKRLSSPVDVQIELTESCNQKCVHCYNFWRYAEEARPDELGVRDFLAILRKLQNSGISVITLTGGEPLLRRSIFFSLLEQAKKYGMEVGLNSNAVLVDKDSAKRMSDLGLDHALISVLGTESTHNLITNLPDGFKKTSLGISNLIESGIAVAVNMAVSKLNQHEVYEVGKIAKELGVKTFCATPMVPSDKSHLQYLLSGEECKEVLRTLLLAKERFGYHVDTLEPIARCLFTKEDEDDFIYFFGNRICSAAVSSCAVSSKGNIRPCIHADKEFGNLLKEELPAIWERMKFWANKDILPKECRGCGANVICEGGCRMSAKLTCGEYNGKDMYMTKPVMEPDRIQKLPKRNGKMIEENTILRINPKFRLRKEDFGGIAYVGSRIEFCTGDGLNFINQLKSKSSFTIKKIAEELKYKTDQIIPIINHLFNAKIIIPADKAEKGGG